VSPAVPPDPLAEVRGVTISCQTWGWEWGTQGFGAELADLGDLGANWVAIHPYARIGADGSVRWRKLDPEHPPDWLRVPIEEAREHGFGLLVKPHLAYWGTSFRWRGDIAFEDAEQRKRFFADYTRWIVALARAARGCQAFAVGTELSGMLGDEAAWRELISQVRAVTDAHLTYAANWDDFDQVPFWDALDVVGVQAYFPLTEAEDPGEAELHEGWRRVLDRLRALHDRVGKPVVFTEFGYNLSLDAARAPYAHAVAKGRDRERAAALQARCLRVGLQVLAEHRDWLRGAFLWKWFVGEPGYDDENFLVDTPSLRRVLAEAWRRP